MLINSRLDESQIFSLKTKEIEAKANSIRNPLLKPILFDYSDGLSPDEIAILAVIVNPNLQVIRDKMKIVSAQLIDAGVLPNPQFSYDFATPVGGDTEGKINALGFGLGYDITSLISHNLRVKGAKANVSSVNLDVGWNEWQVAENAKLHALRLVIAKERILTAKKLEIAEKQIYEFIKEGFSLGTKTIIEFSDSETNLQKARLTISDAQSIMKQERIALNNAIGFPPEKVIMMEQNTRLPPFKMTMGEETLTEGIEEKRLDLLALKVGYQGQESLLQEAIRSQFPKISIGATSNKDTDGLKTMGLGINMNFPFFDRNQGPIAKERATRKMLFDEYATRVFEAKSNIARIVASIKTVEKQILYSNKSISKTKIMAEGYQNALKDGQAEALSYYKALTSLYTEQLQRIELEQQLVDLGIALEISSGRFGIIN